MSFGYIFKKIYIEGSNSLNRRFILIIFFNILIFCLVYPLAMAYDKFYSKLLPGWDEKPDIRVEPNFLRLKKFNYNLSIENEKFLHKNQTITNINAPFIPGQMIVKFKKSFRIERNNIQTSDSSVNGLLRNLKANNIKRIFPENELSLKDIYLISFDPNNSVSNTLQQAMDDPDVEWAEPNYLYSTFVIPDDQDYNKQWGLKKIKAEEAWDINRGDPDVVIAIIDTGVDYNHPDLADNIWRNPGEIPNNNIDDDNNGYIDDDIGWDFVSVTSGGANGEDMGPRDRDPIDFHGHGTHCAGIASASTNNKIGIAGVSWGCKIMPLRAGYKTPTGDGSLATTDTSSALYYAADNNANVISMSWGGAYSFTLQSAINYALHKGCVLIAAAGNESSSYPIYPAGFDGVIAVAASDTNDQRAYFSNYGQWVDIAAPGRNIYSTYLNNNYVTMNGTSMATPLVAGVASLIISQDRSLLPDQVNRRLIDSADDVGWAKRLNAYNALYLSNNLFTIYNDGDAILNVTNIVSQSNWLSTDKTTITIPSKGFAIVNVLINTDGLPVGSYHERLMIYSNDPDENPYPDGVDVFLEIINRAPQINSITINPNPVDEYENCTISVSAFDPDGDHLNYDWYVSDGSIEGSGSTVIYYPPEIFQQQAEYTINVTVSDTHSAIAEGSVNVTVTTKIPITTINIPLYEGWNLISIPVKTTDNSIENILSPIAGKYVSIWSYNNGWNLRVFSTSFRSKSEINSLETGFGYWIKMLSDSVLTITGKALTDTSIQLNAGWNLIGCNSISAKSLDKIIQPISDQFISLWGYDNQRKQWYQYIINSSARTNSLEMIEPGKGYWLNVKSECVLDFDIDD